MKPVAKPTLEVISPAPTSARWLCIRCTNVAVLMHKGTTYCRECYDEGARMGRLIG